MFLDRVLYKFASLAYLATRPVNFGTKPQPTHTNPHLIQQLMGNGILTTRTKQPILVPKEDPTMDEVYLPEPGGPIMWKSMQMS